MRRTQYVLLSFCLVVIAATLLQIKRPLKGGHPRHFGVQARLGVSDPTNARITETYGKLPLSFEANQGQSDSKVRFISRGSGYSLFLTSNEAVLSLKKPRNQSRDGMSRLPAPASRGAVDRGAAVGPTAANTTVVRMKLIGANTSSKVTGMEKLPGKSNYFIGNDPAKWRMNVPAYAKVRYQNVYSGIDLVYYGNQKQLEYDFVVAPGADPYAIRIAIDGHEKLRIDSQNDLVLDVEGSEIRLHQPVIYQEISGVRQRIGGNFVIQGGPSDASAKEGERQIGFDVARYDESKPLIIDPVLTYSTYLGGSDIDAAFGIAVDSAGNAYVTGITASPNFPTANAFQAGFGGGNGFYIAGLGSADAFVTKLNADGSLAYSTYLGGNGDDYTFGIAVDSSGSAYVTGVTTSPNFPTTPNSFQSAYDGDLEDAFVTKLSANGSALGYSTYFTGSSEGHGIAVDSSGNAYVTGETGNAGFVTTANAFQMALRSAGHNLTNAFVRKLNAAGSALVYSTFLGGSITDSAFGIAVDSSGNAYVTGFTRSPNFPTANAFQAAIGGSQNAFVSKLNPAGSALVYSTYLGGSGQDQGNGIAVDSSGNAYVTGTTRSANFPTANAFQSAIGGSPSAFVTKLDPTGTALVYSTYLGGSTFDGGGYGIAVNSFGNVYVTGTTASTNFPSLNAFQAVLRGSAANAFVTELNVAGNALVYSTYLGAAGGNDRGITVSGGIYSCLNIDGNSFGCGIAVDSSGNAYVAGNTISPNFPTANAFQAAYGGGNYDAFVTKFPAIAEGTLFPPLLAQGAVVNGASFAAGAPVAPGSIVSIFGSNFAGTSAGASSTPLPTALLTTSATIDARPIPLYYVSPTQINAQVPFETPTGTATLAVTVNGALSPAVTFPVAATAPGIFLYNRLRGDATIGGVPTTFIGPGAVAVNADGSLNAADHPAKPGDVIVVYMTGQGAVSNPILTGTPALAGPLSATLATTTATVGGANAEVLFSGLAPGFVGLLQANIRIPTVAAGERPLVVTIGEAASQSAMIAVASP